MLSWGKAPGLSRPSSASVTAALKAVSNEMLAVIFALSDVSSSRTNRWPSLTKYQHSL
jgi:hypothetical protein